MSGTTIFVIMIFVTVLSANLFTPLRQLKYVGLLGLRHHFVEVLVLADQELLVDGSKHFGEKSSELKPRLLPCMHPRLPLTQVNVLVVPDALPAPLVVAIRSVCELAIGADAQTSPPLQLDQLRVLPVRHRYLLHNYFFL